MDNHMKSNIKSNAKKDAKNEITYVVESDATRQAKDDKFLLNILIKTEADIVLARRRARQIALLLGFDALDQTRVATALNEIARNAFVDDKDGRIDFCVSDAKIPFSFVILITGNGAGITALEQAQAGKTGHIGLHGAARLVNKLTIETSAEGKKVRLEKHLALRTPFSEGEIDELVNSLARLVASDPQEEVYQQNQELLNALDQITQNQNQLEQLNSELKNKNDQLNKLNEQMQQLNSSLDAKVSERTVELSKLNDELRAARDQAVLANQLKNEFVSNVSHEIRTPVSAILGFSEILTLSSNPSDLDPELREMLTYISSAAKQLIQVVGGILDFSKLQGADTALAREEFFIGSLFDEVLQHAQYHAGTKKIVVSDLVDPVVSSPLCGDATRLRKVLLNLMLNAVKFTDEGAVQIRAKCQTEEDDKVFVRFEVEDQGIGIPEPSKHRLFQPFVQIDGSTTRKYEGLGLGLAISKTLIEQMGGHIGCESSPGQGSTFFCTVPLERANSDSGLSASSR
jgi:signal transduction histidine kinase